jgi:peptidoglycan/xylan/chitin deacetylase (PgdA/CDA1 family)
MRLRPAIRRHIRNSLVSSGVLRIAGRLRPPAAAILMYHAVSDDAEDYARFIGYDITHNSREFAQQMELLARHYHPVTIDDVRQFVSGAKPLPPKAVAVTFDDGYADNFEVAMPVLNRAGAAASFYVAVEPADTARPPWPARLRHAFFTTRKPQWQDPSGKAWPLIDGPSRQQAFLVAVGGCACLAGTSQDDELRTIEQQLEAEAFAPPKNVMMTWEQVRKLAAAGHVVGSHTLTHPNVAHVAAGELDRELRESKRKLEQVLGRPVTHFSYPAPGLTPHWSEQTIAATRQLGYQTAVTSSTGPVRRGDSPFCLHRVPAPRDFGEFRWYLDCTFLGRAM